MYELGLGSKFPAEGSYLSYAINYKLKAIPRHKLKRHMVEFLHECNIILFNLLFWRSQLCQITVRRYSPMVDIGRPTQLIFDYFSR